MAVVQLDNSVQVAIMLISSLAEDAWIILIVAAFQGHSLTFANNKLKHWQTVCRARQNLRQLQVTIVTLTSIKVVSLFSV